LLLNSNKDKSYLIALTMKNPIFQFVGS